MHCGGNMFVSLILISNSRDIQGILSISNVSPLYLRNQVNSPFGCEIGSENHTRLHEWLSPLITNNVCSTLCRRRSSYEGAS